MPLKSLDDLPDDPLRDRAQVSPNAQEFVAQARAMLDDGRYHFAFDTIERMEAWVTKNGVVTKAMVQALENIAISVSEHEEAKRGKSRRYEGFKGRRY